jgi:phage protein U
MHESLRSEVDKSKVRRRTTWALRRFVLGAVDESLREHYGGNYSDRCFQSATAIREVLKFLEIGCKLWNGHVCMTRVTIVNEAPEFGWAGFWDRDDHVWAFNEFGELIDLAISHLHQHSASALRVDLPIPAIWWDDVTRWPSTMIYMPAGNPIAEFSPVEAQDTDRFMEEVREKVKARAEEALGQGYEKAVLSGSESLNALMEQKHPWVLLCSHAQHIPMPTWVVNRMEELRSQVERPRATSQRAIRKKRTVTLKKAPKKRKGR